MAQSNINLKDFYGVIKKNGLLYAHQFIVTFTGEVPDELKSDPNNYSSLTYYVKSAEIPKVEIDEASVSFLSQDFVVPKGVKYTGTWNVNLMATNSLNHWRALREWMAVFADLKNNGGGKKTIPNVIATVKLLDNTLQIDKHDFVLEGVFPTKVPDLPMRYENAATIPEIAVSFAYQYVYYKDDGDPLSA